MNAARTSRPRAHTSGIGLARNAAARSQQRSDDAGATEDALLKMAAHLFLAEQPFSRNRHYEAFHDARFRAALLLYRRLRALLAELDVAQTNPDARIALTEEQQNGARVVRLELRAPRLRRTAWFELGLWNVFLLHPKARALITILQQR